MRIGFLRVQRPHAAISKPILQRAAAANDHKRYANYLQQVQADCLAGNYYATLERAEMLVKKARELFGNRAPAYFEAKLLHYKILYYLGKLEDRAVQIARDRKIVSTLTLCPIKIAVEYGLLSSTIAMGMGKFQKSQGCIDEVSGLVEARTPRDAITRISILLHRCVLDTHRARFLDAAEHLKAAQAAAKLSKLRSLFSSSLLNHEGVLAFHRGDYTRAEECFERVRKIFEKRIADELMSDRDPALANLYFNLAMLCRTQGLYATASSHLAAATAIRTISFGSDCPAMAECHHERAKLFYDQALYDEAYEAIQRAISIAGHIDTTLASPLYAKLLCTLSAAQRKVGYDGPLEEPLKRALATLLDIYGRHHPAVALCRQHLGELYAAQKNFDKAADTFSQARGIYQHLDSEGHPRLAETDEAIGMLHRMTGEFAQAIVDFKRALEIRVRKFNLGHPMFFMTTLHLALAYLENSQPTHAEDVLEITLKKADACEHEIPMIIRRKMLEHLCRLKETADKTAEAKFWRDELAKIPVQGA